jgi:hypothetical protein
MSGAYTTTPGQAGSFVLQERRRLEAENFQLKQMLVLAWRTWQDNADELRQKSESLNRAAESMARHLEQLGVPLDVNAVTLEVKA